MLRDLYTIGIRPVLEYASVVWAGLSKSDHCRLERINRRAARLVTGITRSDAVPPKILLSRAGLPELHVRRSLHQVLFVHRFVHQLLPDHILDGLSHWLPDSHSQRSYLLRRDKCLRLPRARKNILKLSPVYTAFSVWNSLPDSLLSKPSVQSLKAFFSS